MGRSAKRENGDRMPETTCYLRLATYDLRLYLKSLLAYGPEQLFGKMNAVFF